MSACICSLFFHLFSLFLSLHICINRYDPVRDHWKRLADLLDLRSNFTLVVSGDALYAVGGDKDINTNLDSVEKYSLETDSWR